MEVHDDDVHVGDGDGLVDMLLVDDVPNPTILYDMEGEYSIFNDQFPVFPDFPCMSSSSSCSSTPAPTKPIFSSSASSASSSFPSASGGVLKSDAEEDAEKKVKHSLSSTISMESQSHGTIGEVDCMDVMENFGFMDLIDTNNMWDPSSTFQCAKPNHEGLQQEGNGDQMDELGNIFLEWLKSNRDLISAEDMRSIKLKRATVDRASTCLGSTKEGKKQLLKLILQWVQQYQLQKIKKGPASQLCQNSNPNPNPNPNLNLNLNTCFYPTPWIPAPPLPCVADPTAVVAAPPAFAPVVGYMCEPTSNQTMNCHPYQPPSTEYQVLDPAPSWPLTMAAQYNPFPDNSNLPISFYKDESPYPVYDANGEELVRLGPAATKEARKKRMARQRQISMHHHRHQKQQLNQAIDTTSQAWAGGENCTNLAQPNTGNGVYWLSASASPTVPMMIRPTMDDRRTRPPVKHHRQTPSVRRQGWKPEKNVKFLLEKVLKQSDVCNSGRIVLPKKEAELHLPELETTHSIPIDMEDTGISCVWNMRYSVRFWPNNNSRVYLLENTGDFIRANGLQEGDFIVIYADVKCGKYLISGVKVKQPAPKYEGKKVTRRNVRNSSQAGNGSSSSPIKHRVK